MIRNFKELILKSAKQEKQEERISVEIVYIPDERDHHNQYMSKATVAAACEDFNSNLAAGKISANLYHLSNTDKFEILKSWINEVDMVSVTGEAVKEGTWLGKVRTSP
ncbi:MAG: XkdF-like putative serine protease domain-containing protein [Aeromonas caviae]|nr:XkdF-like putative serine protease domain-containing protein [Aeromonas caviae]